MSRIRNRDTKPEIIVRSFLHSKGYRFRLNRKDLPGNPDIVLPKYRTIIFVNGCFWHRHKDCKYAYNPKSRQRFWEDKFTKNVQRDSEVQQVLKEMGWQVYLIWECETKNKDLLESVVANIIKQIKQIPGQASGLAV